MEVVRKADINVALLGNSIDRLVSFDSKELNKVIDVLKDRVRSEYGRGTFRRLVDDTIMAPPVTEAYRQYLEVYTRDITCTYTPKKQEFCNQPFVWFPIIP
jgi:hypothetical protein